LPTYDYECSACGHAWELYQQITEKPKRQCPNCKKSKAQRLIGTGAAVLFKGSGFYQTDYRSADYKQKASAEKSAGSAPAKGGEASSPKTETKAASSGGAGSSKKD